MDILMDTKLVSSQVEKKALLMDWKWAEMMAVRWAASMGGWRVEARVDLTAGTKDSIAAAN